MSDHPSGDAILQVEGLVKRFQMGGDTIDVLRGLDLNVRAGEFLAIEGRSGEGKSTLLHLLAGLDVSDAGSVMFDGEDIAALAARADRYDRKVRHNRWLRKGVGPLIRMVAVNVNPAERRLAKIRNSGFGFVFQFYHLLPELTVLENTQLAAMVSHGWLGYKRNANHLRERAKELLDGFGMSHRLHHRSTQLSGGERQRVAIARALMNQPRILFADEPTGNLDSATGRQIMAVIEQLHGERGQTIVMVTHDRTLARTADRALLLRDGKLVAEEPQ